MGLLTMYVGVDLTAEQRRHRPDAEGDAREMAGDETFAGPGTTGDIATLATPGGSRDHVTSGFIGADPRQGSSEWDHNDAGRATAMTLLSRMHGWGALWLRVLLWVFRRFLRVRPLRDLSFIHFAQWSVLNGLAVDQAGGVGGRKDKYLLFESNFNGTWHEYIDAFSQVVGSGINAILAGCEGFPGLTPARGFKPFIENHEFVAGHYYSAYPDASATMIRAALELADDVATLRSLAVGSDDTKFAHAWYRRLSIPRVQANLAGQARSYPGRRAYLRQLAFGRKNAAGNAYSFSALIPIRSGQIEALQAHLRHLPRHSDSPLAAVPGTHFGRWVVLDRVFHDSWPEKHEVLDPAYLLFTAVFDRTSRDAVDVYLDQLVRMLGAEADAIWEHCPGWPTGSDRQARINYLRRHQVGVDYLFAAYPGSVDEIHRALTHHERLVIFARQAQRLAPDQLRTAFADAFADADRPAQQGGGR